MIAITHALSAALLHFVWQGLAVTILLWLALFLMRRQPAAMRYAASCAALGLLVVLPAITTWLLYQRPVAAHAPAPSHLGGVSLLVPLPSSLSISWLLLAQTWAVPVWASCVLVFSLRMAWGCTQIAGMRRHGNAPDATLRSAFDCLARRMGLTRPIGLLLSDRADSPSVTGWLRPVVLVPIAAAAGLTPDQLEAVLAHELAHIQRHDYLVNLLQMAAETLLFYHPAVWWISDRIRHERELCCDDLAVRTTGGALCYARALTVLEKMRAARPALALGSTDGPLFYRIRRLVAGGGEYGPSRLSGVVALTLGLACVVLCVNWAHAQERKQDSRVDTYFTPQSDGVTVNTSGAMLLHRPNLEYPAELRSKGISGTVALEVTVDNAGQVVDAHVLSGPTELRKTALASVLNWHFAADGGATRNVQITFQPPTGASEPGPQLELANRGEYVFTTRGPSGEPQTNRVILAPHMGYAVETDQALRHLKQLERELEAAQKRLVEEQNGSVGNVRETAELRAQMAEKMARFGATQRDLTETKERERQIEMLENQLAAQGTAGEDDLKAQMEELSNLRALAVVEPRSPRFADRPLAAIEFRGLTEEAGKELHSRLPVHVGETLTVDSVAAARRVVAEFDQHLEFSLDTEPDGVHLRIHPAGR